MCYQIFTVDIRLMDAEMIHFEFSLPKLNGFVFNVRLSILHLWQSDHFIYVQKFSLNCTEKNHLASSFFVWWYDATATLYTLYSWAKIDMHLHLWLVLCTSIMYTNSWENGAVLFSVWPQKYSLVYFHLLIIPLRIS